VIYVPTPTEMAELDRVTIEELGLPGVVLMENAGRAIAHEIEALAAPGAEVAVVCGAGNNGGDGYVIARWMRARGYEVRVYSAAASDRVGGDAAIHLGVWRALGGDCARIDEPAGLVEHAPAIESAAVVVDALFGTGLGRAVEGHYARIIDVVNRGRGLRVAVDVPSGLCGATGAVLGVAVRADHTVTVAFPKLGLVSAPGFARCGRLVVVDIGIPRELATAHGVGCALVEASDLASLLPPRSLLDHKGRRGHVLVVAGSPGKRGAGRLVSLAALRAGAGLVTLVGGDSDPGAADEVMSAVLDTDAAGAGPAVCALAAGRRAVAIGPGMPTGDGARATVHHVVTELAAPAVIDADGLNHLVGALELVRRAPQARVLTPHPGEAARLLERTTAEIEADRVGAVRALAERSRAVVVLKGARTLVCDGAAGTGFVTVNPTGHDALATAGSGDVLTGVIAALIGQGVDAADAARLGCFLHGRAGERAAARLGGVGVIAGDVIAELPAARAGLGA
jgi:NAD(P)H-hydrate epimerase